MQMSAILIPGTPYVSQPPIKNFFKSSKDIERLRRSPRCVIVETGAESWRYKNRV
jgi:hypothetical protein